MSVAAKAFVMPTASAAPLAKASVAGVTAQAASAQDIVVKMTHVPLHRSDAALANGTAYGAFAKQRLEGASVFAERALNGAVAAATNTPRGVGAEGVGVIVDAGGVTRGGRNPGNLKEGDVVWVSPSAAPRGTWATHTVAAAEHCHKLPAAAAANKDKAALVAGTAMAARALLLAHGGAQQDVLVSGGSGLLALLAANMAATGAAGVPKANSVVAAASAGARFAAAKERLTKAGAKAVVEYSAAGAAKQLPKGFQPGLFLSGVGGRAASSFCGAMAPNGTVVHYGAQHGPGLVLATSHHMALGLTTTGFFLPRALAQMEYGARQAAFEAALTAALACPVVYPTKAAKGLDSLAGAWDAAYVGGGAKVLLTLDA